MSHPKKVAVIGDSLVIEGVAMSLAARADMQTVRVDPWRDDIRQRILTEAPDLIVIELHAPWTTSLVALLCEAPGTEVAALDFNEQKLVVISSRHYATETMGDLLQRIRTSNLYPQSAGTSTHPI